MKKLAQEISALECVRHMEGLCEDFNLNFEEYQNQLFYRYLLYRSHYEGEDCLLFTIQEDGRMGADYLYTELNVEAINAKWYCLMSTREFLETCGWDVDDAIRQMEKQLDKSYRKMVKKEKAVKKKPKNIEYR